MKRPKQKTIGGKKGLKLIRFPFRNTINSRWLKNFSQFILIVIIFTQAFLIIYFYYLHTRENRSIQEYQEALRFILREGGGFNYSACNEYVTPGDPQIVSLAKSLETPEKAFEFVATNIKYRFEVTEDLLFPFVILNKGYSNCIGQANLLASLLIAMSNSPSRVKVVYGSIVLNMNRGNHAWVEFFDGQRWIVLDSFNSI